MMESAFAWIGRIASWIGQFVPQWTIIDTRYEAIKWTTIRLRDLARLKWEPSSKVSILIPGFHLYWPLFSKLEEHPVKRQTLPLQSQLITTSDAETIVAAGVLVYDIEDLAKLLAETWDADDTVRDIAGAALHDVLGHKSWDEIRKGAGKTLDTALRNAAKADLSEYGVRVIEFRLLTLAKTKVYRMLQSTSVEGELK